jgi:hypothetical protein
LILTLTSILSFLSPPPYLEPSFLSEIYNINQRFTRLSIMTDWIYIFWQIMPSLGVALVYLWYPMKWIFDFFFIIMCLLELKCNEMKCINLTRCYRLLWLQLTIIIDNTSIWHTNIMTKWLQLLAKITNYLQYYPKACLDILYRTVEFSETNLISFFQP